MIIRYQNVRILTELLDTLHTSPMGDAKIPPQQPSNGQLQRDFPHRVSRNIWYEAEKTQRQLALTYRYIILLLTACN